MKISTQSSVPVYTISGSSTARPLPEWLARRRKRSLKNDPEYANRVELLQDFEFEEASQCIRISEDGQWVMSTGMVPDLDPFSYGGKQLKVFSLLIFRNIQTTNPYSLFTSSLFIFCSSYYLAEHDFPSTLLRLLEIFTSAGR